MRAELSPYGSRSSSPHALLSGEVLVDVQGASVDHARMLYLGGKGRLGKSLAEAILAHTTRRDEYYEPFLGGGNAFAHIAPHFERTYASDVHEDLMLMWQAVATGWEPPTLVSEDEYRALRRAKASALRGFVGFGCSFGGKWWGGYARSKQNGDGYYAAHAARSVTTIGAVMRAKGTELHLVSYADWAPASGAVVYADPPYRSTTRYNHALDHDAFWLTMAEWSDRGAVVFVSEYAAPGGWRSIYSKDQRRKVSGGTGDMTREHLFVRDLT